MAPTLQTWHAIPSLLSTLVCSDDPSRLVLLPCEEAEEESMILPTWGLFREWNEGDSFLYLIKDPCPFEIHYQYEVNPIRTNTCDAYYRIDIRICSHETSTLMEGYTFLYSSFHRTFVRPSDFEWIEDSQEDYVYLRPDANHWTNLYEMIEKDSSISPRFHPAMYRSLHRKWSSVLRHLSMIKGAIKPELRRRILPFLREQLEEKKRLWEAYVVFRCTPPPYPRKTDPMIE